MNWWDEEVITDYNSWNIAFSAKEHAGYEGEQVVLPLNIIHPVNKIQEPTFYDFVKKSINDSGLYKAPILLPMTMEECKEKAVYDKDFLVPLNDDKEPYLIVINGCNRFFALKELGYQACEFLIIENSEVAWDQAHFNRVDKKWQRADNIHMSRDARRSGRV